MRVFSGLLAIIFLLQAVSGFTEEDVSFSSGRSGSFSGEHRVEDVGHGQNTKARSRLRERTSQWTKAGLATISSASSALLSVGSSQTTLGFKLFIKGHEKQDPNGRCYTTPKEGLEAIVEGGESVVVWDPDGCEAADESWVHYIQKKDPKKFSPMTAGRMIKEGGGPHTYYAAEIPNVDQLEVGKCNKGLDMDADSKDNERISWKVANPEVEGQKCPSCSAPRKTVLALVLLMLVASILG